MGTTELSATRIRNQKRRQGYKRRAEFGRSYEHGGVMVRKSEEAMMQRVKVTKDMTEKDIMKYWGSDVVASDGYEVREGFYTDEQWRAECERRSAALKKQKYENSKAKTKQIGGDHYKNMGIEPWDVVDTWPIEQQIGYHRGGVLKYTMRLGNKDERLQEAKKALHYAEKLVEILESKYGNA